MDWIRRATHKARGLADANGVRNWGFVHFQRKWGWAGHVARHPGYAITYRATVWRDAAMMQIAAEGGLAVPVRPSKRRWMKFEAELQRYCRAKGLGRWVELAEDRDAWAAEKDSFAKWALTEDSEDRDSASE